MDELAATYGMCEFRVFHQRFMIVSDFDAMSAIHKMRPIKVKRSLSMRRAVDSVAPGLFGSELPQWGVERRIVSPAFSHANLRQYVSTIEEASRRFADSVDTGDDGGAVVVNDLTSKFTSELIVELGFGIDPKVLSRDGLMEDLQELLDVAAVRAFAPLPYFLLPGVNWANKSLGRIRHRMIEIVHAAEAKVTTEDATKGSSIAEKFVALNKSEENRLSAERLAGNIETLFIAGTDTTAHTLTWMLCALASDADLQDRVRAEAVDQDPKNYPQRNFQEIIDASPLVSSLFFEVLRHYTPAAFVVVENAVEIEVAGKRIDPHEYNFILPLRYHGLNAPNLPGGPSQAFEPLRWVDSTTTPPKLHPRPPQLQPFGGSPRICPAKDLAQLEACLCAARLVRQYSLRIRDDGLGPRRTIFSFTTRPDRDVAIYFTKRS